MFAEIDLITVNFSSWEQLCFCLDAKLSSRARFKRNLKDLTHRNVFINVISANRNWEGRFEVIQFKCLKN